MSVNSWPRFFGSSFVNLVELFWKYEYYRQGLTLSVRADLYYLHLVRFQTY